VAVLLAVASGVQAQEEGDAAPPGRLGVEATCTTQDISIELEADQSGFVVRIPKCVCFKTADGLERYLREGWGGSLGEFELSRTLDFGETMPTETFYCYDKYLVETLIDANSERSPPDSTSGVIDFEMLSPDAAEAGVTAQ
jgi:hypothetical protein